MSQAATGHVDVDTYQNPLTPESWSKLAMWIFLAGDAMSFGGLLAAYGALRSSMACAEGVLAPRWPYLHVRHRHDWFPDVPAHLQQCHGW
jgi:heme/copper-type cytochrome/quinol oxidase subunit 3